jgi:hypothetical protein
MGKLDNPVRRVDKPKIDRRPQVRYLDTDEEARLRRALIQRDQKAQKMPKSANLWRRKRRKEELPTLTYFADHLTPAVLISMNTGLRRGELLALTWADVIVHGRILTVRSHSAKTGDTRHVPLNDEALETLQQWRKQNLQHERLFPIATSFKTAWAALLEEAMIAKRFRWHDLRHHFASRLVQAGVPLNTVRELLGHGSMAMTIRYAHLAPDQKREAVDKLARILKTPPANKQGSAPATAQQHLHTVGAFVDEEVGVMRSRFAKHAHNAGQCLIDAGTHVERFYCQPGRIDADHLMSSRSSSAHSCAADAGRSTLTVPPRRRTSMRIVPSAGFEGSATGTKLSPLSIAKLGAVARIAIGLPLRSTSLAQRCNMLALSPRANATAAIDTPGCWHAPTASALKCALWVRRRRRLVSTTCAVVFTYTPIS